MSTPLMDGAQFATLLDEAARVAFEERQLMLGQPITHECGFDAQPNAAVDHWRLIAATVLAMAARHKALAPDVVPHVYAAITRARS